MGIAAAADGRWRASVGRPSAIEEKPGLKRLGDYQQAVLILDEQQRMGFFERG